MLWESCSYGVLSLDTGKLKQGCGQARAVGFQLLRQHPWRCVLCRLHSCSLPPQGPCSSLQPQLPDFEPWKLPPAGSGHALFW